MKKHLFLEGPIQEGKSTLIRSLIRDRLQQVGGFSSQRLLNDGGKTVGFRIAPPEEALALTAKYSPELSDVFLYFGGEKTEVKPEIFADTAVKYLRQREEKKLILLDEIGGVELLDPDFRKELYNVLKGDIPCLGVLKLENSNRGMCEGANIGSPCTSFLLQLRKDLIDDFDADIIPFDRGSAKAATDKVKAFVDAVFAERRVES